MAKTETVVKMEKISSILKEKRLSTGMSLEKLAENTKIQIHVLRAIENGEQIDVGGASYERLTLINIAKAIGLSQSEIDKIFSIEDNLAGSCPNDSSDNLFPAKLMINKNSILCVLLVLLVVLLSVSIGSYYKKQQIRVPFRGNSQLTEDEDLSTTEIFDEDIPLPEEDAAEPS